MAVKKQRFKILRRAWRAVPGRKRPAQGETGVFEQAQATDANQQKKKKSGKKRVDPKRTLCDYIDWRGDLSFAVDPLNEVDNLVLSWIVYLELDGYGADVPYAGRISLKDALAVHDERCCEPIDSKRMSSSAEPLFRKLAASNRFGDVRMWGFVRKNDGQQQEQFAACCFEITDDLAFVAFRGTDDTLLGWREDFNMCFMDEVPAQRDAVSYLAAAAEDFPGRLQVGGHSKGGNLAVYAAVRQQERVRRRIDTVFNNDGPGFREDMLHDARFVELRPRIRTVVPQSSVIGMLLEHSEEYVVVRSEAIWAMQHDAMSWEVRGNHFVCLDSVTPRSQLTDRSLKKWMEDKDAATRALFVDALFQVLDSTGAETFSELTENGIKSALSMLRSIKGLDREVRRQVFRMLAGLMRIGASMWVERTGGKLKRELWDVLRVTRITNGLRTVKKQSSEQKDDTPKEAPASKQQK